MAPTQRCVCCERDPRAVQEICSELDRLEYTFIKECPVCHETKCGPCWGGFDQYVPDIADAYPHIDWRARCTTCWVTATLDISHSQQCCFRYTQAKIKEKLPH